MNIALSDEQLLPIEVFGTDFAAHRVLYEAEQPIIFTTKTSRGQELLAYVASEAQDAQYLVLTPATPSLLDRLERGSIGVREALSESWMWLAKRTFDGSPSALWSVDIADIPADYLPLAGTPLYPQQTIVFSARAIGAGIELGRVPCSVISFVADAARASLKAALDFVMVVPNEGRPTDAQRALYDLPVQQLRFASFEVGLAAPIEDLFQAEPLASAVNILERGLSWAEVEEDSDFTSAATESETEAILRATLALTPPTSGPISAVEIGGAWLNGRTYHLTRKSRLKVGRNLRKLRTEEIVVYVGRIGEIDDDKLSFILREVDGAAEYKGTFPEAMLDDMRGFYFEANRVQISGVVRSNKLKVTAVVNHD